MIKQRLELGLTRDEESSRKPGEGSPAYGQEPVPEVIKNHMAFVLCPRFLVSIRSSGV